MRNFTLVFLIIILPSLGLVLLGFIFFKKFIKFLINDRNKSWEYLFSKFKRIALDTIIVDNKFNTSIKIFENNDLILRSKEGGISVGISDKYLTLELNPSFVINNVNDRIIVIPFEELHILENNYINMLNNDIKLKIFNPQLLKVIVTHCRPS